MARAEYLKEHIKVGRAVPGGGYVLPRASLCVPPTACLVLPLLVAHRPFVVAPVASLLPLTLAASGPTDERVPPGG